MPRTKKADQTKNDDKTAQDAAQEPETAEQVESNGNPSESPAERVLPGAEEQGSEVRFSPQAETEQSELCDDAEPDMFANLPNPCVYCGPSVKGVARQYTTYQGGIPDALREFIRKHPVALGLIVSTGNFQAMRKRLEMRETPEAKLYKAVKAEV